MLSDVRIGKFTSSEIYLLMKKGRGSMPSVATTSYIEEKAMERRLGRSLNSDSSGRSTTWGSIIEKRLYSLLDSLEYTYCSSDTIVHPTIDSWAGTPDFLTLDRVCDGKCPFTLKSFCQLADISIAKDLEKLKETKPDYYWQLVSNAILSGKKNAELITYCPYLDELQDIREMVSDEEGNQNKLAWIYFSDDTDLPYLIKGGYYKNLYKLEFEVPKEDVEALTEAVVMATEQLEVL